MRSSPCRAALREETYAIQQNQVAKRGGTSEEVDEGNRDKLSGNAGSGFPREAGGSTGAVEIRGCLAAASTGRPGRHVEERCEPQRAELKGLRAARLRSSSTASAAVVTFGNAGSDRCGRPAQLLRCAAYELSGGGT